MSKYNKEVTARYQQTFKGRATRLLNSSRSNARKGGLEFNLTREWIEDRLHLGCARTGVPFELSHRGGRGFARVGDTAPSLDRINPSKGYTMDNVQVVTWIYNRAKLQSTDEEVLEFARALVRAHGG